MIVRTDLLLKLYLYNFISLINTSHDFKAYSRLFKYYLEENETFKILVII